MSELPAAELDRAVERAAVRHYGVPDEVTENGAEITPLLVRVSPSPRLTPVAEQPVPVMRPLLVMVEPLPAEVSMPTPQALTAMLPVLETTAIDALAQRCRRRRSRR